MDYICSYIRHLTFRHLTFLTYTIYIAMAKFRHLTFKAKRRVPQSLLSRLPRSTALHPEARLGAAALPGAAHGPGDTTVRAPEYGKMRRSCRGRVMCVFLREEVLFYVVPSTSCPVALSGDLSVCPLVFFAARVHIVGAADRALKRTSRS